MTEDLKEIKKQISAEWREAFPELTPYAPTKFYKIIGPVITGIELIKLPYSQDYRPYFVIYSLWENSVKFCLDAPIVLEEFRNRKNLQYNIPYEKHNLYFNDVLDSIKDQLPISFNDNLPGSTLLYILHEYNKKSPLCFSSNSFLHARLQAFRFHIALYSSTDVANEILEAIIKTNWDLNHFKLFNKDLNTFVDGLKNQLDHRKEFLQQIAVNSSDKKLAKLKRSELIS